MVEEREQEEKGWEGEQKGRLVADVKVAEGGGAAFTFVLSS